MAIPRLFGADYSVYVRIARLALAEKGVACEQVPIDAFMEGGVPADYLARHPFGRIPAFEHDGFALYETGAITRYVDEAFPGPALQPADPRQRARCNQIISIADSYAYPALVWGLFVERIEKPARLGVTDEDAIALALGRSRMCLAAVADLLGPHRFLAGEAPSLADLHLAPMLDYALKTGEGRDLLAALPPLAAWWKRLAARPSLREILPT